MKIKLLVFAAVASSVGMMNAATVNTSAFDLSAAPLITGGVYVNGVPAVVGQVSVNNGYFNQGFDVTAAVAANDYSSLVSAFNIVATTQAGSTASIFGENYAGLFDTGNGAFIPGAGSIGQNLFNFYGLGADLATSTIWALMDTGVAIIADGFPPEAYQLTPTQGVLLNDGPMAQIITGNFSASAVGIAGQDAPAINLVIPEPSAALLGALGALGLLRRRRN